MPERSSSAPAKVDMRKDASGLGPRSPMPAYIEHDEELATICRTATSWHGAIRNILKPCEGIGRLNRQARRLLSACEASIARQSMISSEIYDAITEHAEQLSIPMEWVWKRYPRMVEDADRGLKEKDRMRDQRLLLNEVWPDAMVIAEFRELFQHEHGASELRKAITMSPCIPLLIHRLNAAMTQRLQRSPSPGCRIRPYYWPVDCTHVSTSFQGSKDADVLAIMTITPDEVAVQAKELGFVQEGVHGLYCIPGRYRSWIRLLDKSTAPDPPQVLGKHGHTDDALGGLSDEAIVEQHEARRERVYRSVMFPSWPKNIDDEQRAFWQEI